jgi:hypothetical protein
VARTEAALALHLGEGVRRAAAAQLGGDVCEQNEAALPPPSEAAAVPDAHRRGRERRLRSPPRPAPPEAMHLWRLCPWEADVDDASPAAAASPPPQSPPPPPLERSAERVLFALRRDELSAALGAAGISAFPADGEGGSGIAVPARVSAALSAAQWRLEAFRPGCRPPGLRASGEAPRDWAPPRGWAAGCIKGARSET